eukprot:TRINITY_DN31960_c0_g3_i1.p1 TRINITY_DN31960_c0_g3~~TRINITY_DN31960_c0_g3_i1.p1  ORF type:complete len:3687 (+),score=983.36 TRINITY_DN31960_c0_g3_i1:94-11154(+)
MAQQPMKLNGRHSVSAPQGLPPLLIHLDVNKTVIQTDSIRMDTLDEGLREGIADLFWGRLQTKSEGGELRWEWTRSKPTCNMPTDVQPDGDTEVVNYSEFCKRVVKDKTQRKTAMRSFSLVGEEAREEMEKLLQVTLKKMELESDLANTPQAQQAGLMGATVVMFPSIFRLVATLQRAKRVFGVVFRSFGNDHHKIMTEWNAFCEMRHPLFSKLLHGIGPLDGTVPGVPDRRIHRMHTLYRDAEGPVLILDKFTNGPSEKTWDSWVKNVSPKPTTDLRGGREFIRNSLKAQTVDGVQDISKFMKDLLLMQHTSAIKDDWAWWTWHGETTESGKLLTCIEPELDTKQLFFDDNIDFSNPRIVDCREYNGQPVPADQCMNRLCTKVNPVEALLDDDYFLRKLQVCHGDHLDVGGSFLDFQSQLAEAEEMRLELLKQVKSLTAQLGNLTENHQRMTLLNRINVRDEAQLKDILSTGSIDCSQFGEGAHRTIKELFDELEQGYCWLQNTEGQLTRIFEMVYLKIQYKDLVLIESHEQDAHARIQSRSYLPGVRKNAKEASFAEGIDRFMTSGLQVNLKGCVVAESLPVFNPDAPTQVSHATQCYPLPSKVQESEAAYFISEKVCAANQEIFGKLGLPGGKHFTTTEDDLHGGTITRFWRWDKVATWEAQASSQRQIAVGGKGASGAQQIDIAAVCEKLFRGHPRREAYENLLLQMFDTFTAKKLCGGFSGSVVIRVQPVELDGRPGEPCIVKLDRGEPIREEFVNSMAVFRALPDRAAKIIGDAVYTNSSKDGAEFGAMRLELAGACWNVPELAQGSENLLCTLKDLLLYESEQIMLGADAAGAGERPFGNVNTVVAETFGPGGVVASLRKGGKGLNRSETSLFWGWYSLKGKESKFNPYTAEPGQYPPTNAMKAMYKTYFGSEMPDLKELVVHTIKPQLEKLAKEYKDDFCPLVGLAHGDLNAANIMIDALDAVWLIDFATSVELPLFTDMAKFEMACLFEYAAIPITPKVLLDFSGRDEEKWGKLGVHDWLRVKAPVALALLEDLAKMPTDRVASITQNNLDRLIEDVASKTTRSVHKQREVVRSLKARLTADDATMDSAFALCADCSKVLLKGDYLLDALDMQALPEPEGQGAAGGASLRFFMQIAFSIRRYMTQDVLGCLRDYSQENKMPLLPSDATALQLWLPILRESYRIMGYQDISPPQKLWSIYHCNVVADNVLKILSNMSSVTNLKSLAISSKLERDLATRKMSASGKNDSFVEHGSFSEADSRRIYARKDLFPSNIHQDRILRKVHSLCHIFSETPGFFAPIYKIETKDDHMIDLDFHPGVTEETWRIILRDYETDVVSEMEFDPTFGGWIGSFIASAEGEECLGLATMRSRLLFLTGELLQRYTRKALNYPTGSLGAPVKNFSMIDWCGRLFAENGDVLANRSLRTPGNTPNAGRSSLVIPEELPKFMTLEAVVVDESGQERLTVDVILGYPTMCFAPGNHLCIDCGAMQQGRLWSPEVTVVQLNESGYYQVVNSADAEPGENERDYEPTPSNHIYLEPCSYKVGQRILFNEEGQWTDAKVIENAGPPGGYRYLVQTGDSPQPELRYLHRMNSGIMWLSAAAYEEEIQKIKVYFKARNSFIIDALSGTRLDVKTTAQPTLVCKSSSSPSMLGSMPSNASDGGSSQNSMRRATTRSLTRGSSYASTGGPSDIPELQQGWKTVISTLEQFEQGLPNCSPTAFLVFGSPGSGKSCLVHRLIMECLDRQMDLVPLLVPVAELVKRSGLENEAATSSAAVHAWFEKYLSITFGEDSQRYKMVRQAIAMHRVMFLFEGLEDAGSHMPFVERLIGDIVMDSHLIVITSRHLMAKDTNLVEMHEHITTLELQRLSNEQKRAIAHTRLGLAGLGDFNQFFQQLRQSQSVVEESVEADEDEYGEDVFGNPMMLSMLLCYLKSRQEEHAKAQEENRSIDETDKVTLTAVYRVAMDVMLQRVQSKHQADRHNKEEKVEQCKLILEKMAMKMHLENITEIEEEDVNEILKDNPGLLNTWTTLRSAAEAGHAMFLRMSDEDSGMEFRFLVKGFQDFFAASGIAREGSAGLPALATLLQDSWWAQTLAMLAESWPHRYVRVIEDLLQNFKEERGASFLHMAASVGHRPVFQLLKRFTEANQKALQTRNDKMETPLHVAAQKGNIQICALMLEHGAQVDVEDANDRMPMHAAMQNAHFQTAKFLLERMQASETNKRDRCLGREHPAEKLATCMLAGEVNEAKFLTTTESTFVELNFFGKAEMVEKKREMGALLAIFWISADQYKEFVRGQKSGSQLTRASWEKLQAWTKDTVGLTREPATLAAMLVLCAIYNVGKIKEFRKTFAPGFDDPFEALVVILQRAPTLCPSFAKLEEHLQTIILMALKADFNFGQFLQAENLPASLLIFQEVLGSSSSSEGTVNVLGFFLFRIFATMCGILGMKSLEGSLFMDNMQYRNYDNGLGVLQNVLNESAQSIYNRFLAQRAKAQELTFDTKDDESRACVRLACLARTFSPEESQDVSRAFHSLSSVDRWALTKFLNADGISERGFLLYGAPQLMENAKVNPNIGFIDAMRMLLRVYEMANEEYANSSSKVVTIMLDELTKHALHCEDSEVFEFTKFSISRTPGAKAEIQGSVILSPWQLMNSIEKQEKLTDEADSLVTDVMFKLMREPAFNKRLQPADNVQAAGQTSIAVFPEMRYFTFRDGDTEAARKIEQQTRAALLVVYWVTSDQHQAFTRGAADKLSERSWTQALEIMESVLLNQDKLNAVFVAMMIHGLGELEKLREQLAPPEIVDGRQVLRHVMETCPKFLPSYARLLPEYRALVLDCLTMDFSFTQFLRAENLPVNLTVVKETLQKVEEQGMTKSEFMNVFLTCIFAQLSGSKGSESLEGSLYMTEENFRRFHIGARSLQLLEIGRSEQEAYDALLEMHGEALELEATAESDTPVHRVGSQQVAPIQKEDLRKKRRAIVRLACLADIVSPEGAQNLSKAFHSLDAREQRDLARHLDVDGIRERPGFLLKGSPEFLKSAQENTEIGLLAAIRILLKVYQAASKTYGDSTENVVEIHLHKLVIFAKEFFGAAAFDNMQFELHQSVVIPKVWIPVSNECVLDALRKQGFELASTILAGKATEEMFVSQVGRTFPELSYFNHAMLRRREQTFGAMLAVYWLISGQHEAFIRGQKEDEQLSKQSWAWIQDWMNNTVKLSTQEAVDAALVFMAIHALGKIPDFRDELLPGFGGNKHDEALAQILTTRPEVVPSFSRLSGKYRSLIIDSLSVDFRFGQFLQAENVPANMVHMKEKLRPHGDDGFAFFCFKIFAQMCGRMGASDNKGSMFMNESQFQRFRPGLDALQHLRTLDAAAAYNGFLLVRGTKAMSRFASPEHQALARLLCLGAAFDQEGGQKLCDAFEELPMTERLALTRWLNADGIQDRPGYVILQAPLLFDSARQNPAVGLATALKLLLRVQQRCVEEASGNGHAERLVVVHLDDLALFVANAGIHEADAGKLNLEYRSVLQHDVRVVRVEPSVASQIDRVRRASFASAPSSVQRRRQEAGVSSRGESAVSGYGTGRSEQDSDQRSGLRSGIALAGGVLAVLAALSASGSSAVVLPGFLTKALGSTPQERRLVVLTGLAASAVGATSMWKPKQQQRKLEEVARVVEAKANVAPEEVEEASGVGLEV